MLLLRIGNYQMKLNCLAYTEKKSNSTYTNYFIILLQMIDMVNSY